jgi:23S rRNA (cytosine1962-C5)-methyltransferase
MFQPDQYQLLDFGEGRKLERFGDVILDRPAPAAEQISKLDPAQWVRTDGQFVKSHRSGGNWSWSRTPPDSWFISHRKASFELKPTGFGHIGIFPEQAACWDWIAGQLEQDRRPAKVLNLFAYTGGSTLAAAQAGAEVVHVDAAKNVVLWARRNALASGMSAAPIRWIVEDARRFVARERRRGNEYDAIILDPPSYSHGPRGESWKIEQHLPDLLNNCARLTAGRCRFILLTCHSSGLNNTQLKYLLRRAVCDQLPGRTAGSTLYLRTESGRRLFGGESVFWLP